MKTIALFSTLVAVISSNAFADYNLIPQEKLELYKTAILIAGQKSHLYNCSESGNFAERFLASYIKKADAGKISLDSKQPILIFENSSVEGRPNTKAIVTVVSSADYNNVVSVQVQELQLSDVNVGDLRNPQIVKRYIVTSSAECK